MNPLEAPPRGARRVLAIVLGGVRLSRRGWMFAASAVVAFVTAYAAGRDEFLFVGTLLTVLPVMALVYVRVRQPRVEVTRSFSPPVIQASSTTSVTLTVRNARPSLSTKASWWDTVPWTPGVTEELPLPSLQPRGTRYLGRGNSVVLHYELRPPRRGMFAVGPFIVAFSDPFGLASSDTAVGGTDQLIVTPEVSVLGESGLSVPAGDGESRVVQRRSAGDEDDSMTREYRNGDAMRRVHWRASARHGNLMVRQEEQRSFPEARIIVDTRSAGFDDRAEVSRAGEVESPAFEWVVRMLASVAVHLRRVGFLVTIDESGLAQLDDPDSGRRRTWGDEEFLSTLASLHLTATPAGRHPQGKRSGRGPLVAIVGSPDADTVSWLLSQREPGELAVVFMVRNLSSLDRLDRSFGQESRSAMPGASRQFTDAGWLVVPVRDDDDPGQAWNAVVFETGRARDAH